MSKSKLIKFQEKEFFMVYKGIFQKKGLKRTDKMSYLYFSSICSDVNGHYIFPSLKELHRQFQISRPTYKVVVKRLTEADLLTNLEESNQLILENRKNLNKNGNFFFLHYTVIRSDKITARQKLVYAFLMSRAMSDEMKLEVSTRNIAMYCSFSDNARLRKDILALIDVGLIKRKKRSKVYKGKLQYDKYEYQMLAIPTDLDENKEAKVTIQDNQEDIESESVDDIIENFLDS